MTRRNVLALVELCIVTLAAAASLGLLAHAADVDHTQWAEAWLCCVVAALILLVPATLALLLRAVWLGGPVAWRAARARVQDWRQWRGIRRVDAPPARDTMAVRPRTVAHARARRHATGGVR